MAEVAEKSNVGKSEEVSTSTGSNRLPKGIVDEPIRNNDNGILSDGLSNKEEKSDLDPGKKVNEKTGEVEDTSSKKVLKAIGRSVTAYATGGKSIGKDNKVLKNSAVDKTLGVVSNVADKNPRIKKASEALDKSGAADLVNDGLDAAGNVKNATEAIAKGNVKEAANDMKEAAKSSKKVKENPIVKRQRLMLKIKIIVGISTFIIFIAIIAGGLGPVLGGFIDMVEGVTEFVGDVVDTTKDIVEGIGDFFVGTIDEEKIRENVQSTPGWDQLSTVRQNMIVAAATAAAAKIPYNLGGHPAGSGLEGIPNSGLDCAGYIQWIIWTATGSNPGYLTTSEITNRIGTDFEEISKDQLQPGDIALKKKGGSDIANSSFNHVGMYAGDGKWYHESSSKGAVKANYSGFTVYLRYKGA